MKKEWTPYRITTLLYFIIFLLSLNFYFIYTSFSTMQNDTKVMHKTGWLRGTLEQLPADPSGQLLKRIDKTLQEISPWVTQNKDSEFYTGGETLSKDYSELTSCWNSYKETTADKQSITCIDTVKNLDTVIEHIVQPKQRKLINMLYLSLAITMFIILYLIYFIRLYIQQQMKKHAIHDHETKLFNKKYFLSQVKTSCARSARYKHPLSMLSISIDDLEKGNEKYDQTTKEHALKIFGGLITSLTRMSDIAARYDENHFSILLPETEEENALILEKRVREALEKHDVMADLKFKFSTTHFEEKESPEAFITRAQNLLQ